MARPKKEETLISKLLKSEEVDYSSYTHKQLIECIEALVVKVNEKKETLLTEAQLKAMRTALNSQIEKIDAVIPKPTAVAK